MTSGFLPGDVLRGLAVRVLFFLSLALLPIGIIAVAQTRQIAEQNRTNGELSLLAVTEQISTAERQVLQEAFGAAEALASIVKLHSNDHQACSEFFSAYRDATDIYALVGYIPVSGMMTCASSGTSFDFSDLPAFKNATMEPRRRADPFPVGPVTQQRVTAVTSPVFEDDELAGFVALSIPVAAFLGVDEPAQEVTPVTSMTFNASGEVLTSDQTMEVETAETPKDVSLTAFAVNDPTVFWAQNSNGIMRVYAVQPIVQNAVYAISVWSTDTPFLKPSITARLAAFLPIAMWAATLIVAFWALNRLAIRHIRKLGRQMRRFALNRNLPRVTLGPEVPTELVEMEAAFISMGESILRDEAQLEDSLREKNILLKEVHHRVKNNLQLISSIMNMQIRRARSEDARHVLQRLQERILSLATVHKSIYQNDDLIRVDAGALLKETVGQLLSVGLPSALQARVSQHYDQVMLDADDAAPLTLLASEAVTNALKNIPQVASEDPRIDIALHREADEMAVLSISNSKGSVEPEGGTGLGSQLINAFARQLNGHVEVEETEGNYTLTVQFPVPERAKPIYDY